MKFRVERDVLADAVAWTARSLPARPPVPVLAGLLLEVDADGGGLELSSFDYEVSAAVSSRDRRRPRPGRALVSGRLLAEISRSLPAAAGRGRHRRRAKVVLTCGTRGSPC